MTRSTIAVAAALTLFFAIGMAEAHHGRGSHARANVTRDERDGRHGPPSWAPAWGWRRKHETDDAWRARHGGWNWRDRDGDDRWQRHRRGDDGDRWARRDRWDDDRWSARHRDDDRWPWRDRLGDWFRWR